jgi:AcrR family transcriptional regulator
MAATTATRPYRGVSAERRRTERRARLVEAGLEVIASKGSSGATVRDVCLAAGLTERYFYEAFSDREALPVAVFDHVAEHAAGVIVAAVAAAPHETGARARAAIAAFVDLVADDPRRARVLLLGSLEDPQLQRRRLQAVGEFARLVRDQAVDFYGVRGSPPLDAELTAHALVGALAQLLGAWLRGELEVSRERLVDHAAALFVAAAGVRSDRLQLVR